jgi:DNA-binding transcriptional MerR regulator
LLLTVADIARQLQIPEATARYYRDRFALYVPSVGAGRSRRYPSEALDVLRYIATTLRAGTPVALVEAGLAERFPIVGEPAPESSSNTAVTQQQPTAMCPADFATALDVLLAQRETMLREELARQHDEVLDALQQQTATLQQQLRNTGERLAAMERALVASRPWWHALWPWRRAHLAEEPTAQ